MTSCNDNQPLTSEAAFWALFSHPQMIADAMRGYARRPTGPLHPRTVDAMDFATLEKLPAEWIDDDFRRRQGDRIWRVRFRWARDWTDPDDYLLILVEFRSQPDPNIEQCIADYSQQLYEELHAADVVREEGPRPPIFPLVIYNGRQPWNMPIELGALAAEPAPRSSDTVRRKHARLASLDLPDWE